MNKYQVDLYKEFARPYYARKDPAHDFRHIEQILNRLTLLSEGVVPPPRLDRLYFLACFHGLDEPLRDNEQLREQVKTFLRNLDWTDEDIEEAFQSLERHLTDPQTSEERIVHDANYVELLGAFGIAKSFTTGGARGQSLRETADIFEHQYLDKVVFQTPAGQRLAEEGRAYAKRFIARLRSEL